MTTPQEQPEEERKGIAAISPDGIAICYHQKIWNTCEVCMPSPHPQEQLEEERRKIEGILIKALIDSGHHGALDVRDITDLLLTLITTQIELAEKRGAKHGALEMVRLLHGKDIKPETHEEFWKEYGDRILASLTNYN